MAAKIKGRPAWIRRKFGAHLSIAGGHDRAARAAAALGMGALQVFTKSNNQWNAKPLTDEQVAAFRSATAEAGIADPVAHDSYLINLASPDDTLWRKSIDAMAVELERAEALGVVDLVSHPGAHVGCGEEAGIARVAAALDEVHRRTSGFSCRIALETTAGQGSCLGHRFEHLAGILDRVLDADRLSVCVDTCHVFAAGYRLGTASEYNETIGELDRIVGLNRVRAWHLNDSVKGCGSRVDRHAGLGRGELGLEPFGRIVADPRFAALPMILETPKGTEGGEDLDAINLRILRRLEAAAEADAAGGSRAARAS
ncbi:deoxyribonuclease IV [Tautonia plasticadhaerens]|uniref:Probable endonuclease 4 n=1 Tax=Tautonia plasticadhaerens TaxID=2527974 RepID=A0A518H7B8_9BACT|nr:deoxyribonuclease IV [Tautonia plasticadhaerens]QDV36681.1 Endonuclease 4 [Tautonia plasticadhaerens]